MGAPLYWPLSFLSLYLVMACDDDEDEPESLCWGIPRRRNNSNAQRESITHARRQERHTHTRHTDERTISNKCIRYRPRLSSGLHTVPILAGWLAHWPKPKISSSHYVNQPTGRATYVMYCSLGVIYTQEQQLFFFFFLFVQIRPAVAHWRLSIAWFIYWRHCEPAFIMPLRVASDVRPSCLFKNGRVERWLRQQAAWFLPGITLMAHPPAVCTYCHFLTGLQTCQ